MIARSADRAGALDDAPAHVDGVALVRGCGPDRWALGTDPNDVLAGEHDAYGAADAIGQRPGRRGYGRRLLPPERAAVGERSRRLTPGLAPRRVGLEVRGLDPAGSEANASAWQVGRRQWWTLLDRGAPALDLPRLGARLGQRVGHHPLHAGGIDPAGGRSGRARHGDEGVTGCDVVGEAAAAEGHVDADALPAAPFELGAPGGGVEIGPWAACDPMPRRRSPWTPPRRSPRTPPRQSPRTPPRRSPRTRSASPCTGTGAPRAPGRGRRAVCDPLRAATRRASRCPACRTRTANRRWRRTRRRWSHASPGRAPRRLSRHGRPLGTPASRRRRARHRRRAPCSSRIVPGAHTRPWPTRARAARATRTATTRPDRRRPLPARRCIRSRPDRTSRSPNGRIGACLPSP